MLLGHRLLLLGVLSLPVLSGCGSSSHGSESGTIAPPSGMTSGPGVPVPPPKAGPVGEGITGTDDTVGAVASVTALSVAAGGTQTITITFFSSDGMPITGFAVSGSLGSLPAGWSGPGSFSCAVVAPGNGCALSLTYAPASIDSGTLMLNCIYVDNSGLARTPGPCFNMSYAATAANNVVAYASPTGEIDAIAGAASRAVSIDFTTDDGNAASNLTVTNGSGLPTGWSSTAPSLSCTVVSTGSGCRLPLTFAPSAATAGLLTVSYTYTDGRGAARNGAINIPYAAIADDTVISSTAPSGQITAALSSKRPVSVTFTTDDGAAATNFSITSGLATLPAGWSTTAASFTCDNVGSGNGCQLQLSYAPTALGLGNVSLTYAYDNAGGVGNTGLVNIAFAATTDDNVAGSVSPSGEIDAMLGAASLPVTVTFTTDDSRLATALQVTSNLGALPPGWSSAAGSFACSEVTVGNACQLTLMYAPAAVDNGTLNLSYQYVNNAGAAKTATVSIPYRTTTDDNVVGSANPTSLAASIGSTNSVVVTFATDDGNTAGSLSADLSTLPMGWSGPTSLACASVSVGASCQVSLSYAPTAADNGNLTFGFNYVNNAGNAKTGTVSIPYTATP